MAGNAGVHFLAFNVGIDESSETKTAGDFLAYNVGIDQSSETETAESSETEPRTVREASDLKPKNHKNSKRNALET